MKFRKAEHLYDFGKIQHNNETLYVIEITVMTSSELPVSYSYHQGDQTISGQDDTEQQLDPRIQVLISYLNNCQL